MVVRGEVGAGARFPARRACWYRNFGQRGSIGLGAVVRGEVGEDARFLSTETCWSGNIEHERAGEREPQLVARESWR